MRKIAYKQMLKNDVYEDWVGLDTENDWEGISILHNEIEEKKLWKNANQSWEKMHCHWKNRYWKRKHMEIEKENMKKC